MIIISHLFGLSDLADSCLGTSMCLQRSLNDQPTNQPTNQGDERFVASMRKAPDSLFSIHQNCNLFDHLGGPLVDQLSDPGFFGLVVFGCWFVFLLAKLYSRNL